MKYVFISGIPTAGKSYLAEKIADKTGCAHVCIDDLRSSMKDHPELEPMVNFFWNIDEAKYWENISPREHWNNLKRQSEAFWPIILDKVRETQQTGQSAVFEGVNILPHLAYQDFDFPGVVLLGESEQKVFERCRENPRWGKTDELQKREAEWFFVHEGKIYAEEARKYGYKTFHSTEKAEIELIKLLRE